MQPDYKHKHMIVNENVDVNHKSQNLVPSLVHSDQSCVSVCEKRWIYRAWCERVNVCHFLKHEIGFVFVRV